jgi:hypothetical protein
MKDLYKGKLEEKGDNKDNPTFHLFKKTFLTAECAK